jgi:hypothetical protein
VLELGPDTYAAIAYAVKGLAKPAGADTEPSPKTGFVHRRNSGARDPGHSSMPPVVAHSGDRNASAALARLENEQMPSSSRRRARAFEASRPR